MFTWTVVFLSLGLMSIFINFFSLLMILISMEYIILSLFLLIVWVFLEEEGYEVIFFMVFAVVESVMGLVLLILKVFFTGEDLFNLDVN